MTFLTQGYDLDDELLGNDGSRVKPPKKLVASAVNPQTLYSRLAALQARLQACDTSTAACVKCDRLLREVERVLDDDSRTCREGKAKRVPIMPPAAPSDMLAAPSDALVRMREGAPGMPDIGAARRAIAASGDGAVDGPSRPMARPLVVLTDLTGIQLESAVLSRLRWCTPRTAEKIGLPMREIVGWDTPEQGQKTADWLEALPQLAHEQHQMVPAVREPLRRAAQEGLPLPVLAARLGDAMVRMEMPSTASFERGSARAMVGHCRGARVDLVRLKAYFGCITAHVYIEAAADRPRTTTGGEAARPTDHLWLRGCLPKRLRGRGTDETAAGAHLAVGQPTSSSS